jgi:hypothetical protein
LLWKHTYIEAIAKALANATNKTTSKEHFHVGGHYDEAVADYVSESLAENAR